MVLFTNCLSEESSVRVMMIIYFIEGEFEAIERCDLMFLSLKDFFLRKQISFLSRNLFFTRRQIRKL